MERCITRAYTNDKMAAATVLFRIPYQLKEIKKGGEYGFLKAVD